MLVLRIVLAASVASAVLQTLYFAGRSHGARLSESGLLSLISFAESAGVVPVGLLPVWAQIYRLPDSWGAMAAYLLAVFASTFPVVLGAALVLLRMSRASLLGRGSAASGVAVIFAASAALFGPLRDAVYRYGGAGADFASGMRWATLHGLSASLLVAVFLIWLWLRSPSLQQSLARPARAAEVPCYVLLTIAAVATWTASSDNRTPPATGPNILLVSIDTLRADHVHSYGYRRETTPTLDRLASEGVRFETVTSSSSWTLPAHISLLTGLDPLHHGLVSDFSSPLSRDIPTIAEILRDSGYATAAVVSAPYLSARWGYARGFDQYNDYSVDSRSPETWPVVVKQVDQILDTWAIAEPARPLFLFVHLWDPHSDFEPPPPYDSLFDPGYDGDLNAAHFLANPRITPDMPARELEHLIALYDGEIRYTDDGVAALLDRFRKLGQLDSTIVSVTSDHGEEFFEHGRKGHRSTLFEESTQVPWILRYPGRLPAGRVVPSPVRLIDVAPTLLSLAGVHAPPLLHVAEPLFASRDLSALAARDAATLPNLPAFSHLDKPSCCILGPLFAVRTGTAKFIHDPDGKVVSRFYDLDRDPAETENLAGAADPREAVLGPAVRLWSTQSAEERLARPAQIDLEDVEALKDLGYIQ